MTKLSLSPISDADWPVEISTLKDGFAGQLNVYRTMANHPALLKAWADLRDHVVKKSSLAPQQSEVAILRTGFKLNADYEWAHHIVRARKCGMSDTRIATLRGPVEKMNPEDATIAATVDELVSRSAISSKQQTMTVALVGIKGMFDVIATVGFYSTLAYIVNSFGVPIDEDIVRTLKDQPFSE